MKNKKGIAIKAVGEIVLVVVFLVFILAIIAMSFGGFGTNKTKARDSAVNIARAINQAGVGKVSRFEVNIPEGWALNINSDEAHIQVLDGTDVDETYNFEFPAGYNLVCCPKEWDNSESCSTHCTETLKIKGPENREFCVASFAAIDSIGPITHAISKLIHGKKYIYVFPKESMRTCHNLLENIFGI